MVEKMLQTDRETNGQIDRWTEKQITVAPHISVQMERQVERTNKVYTVTKTYEDTLDL